MQTKDRPADAGLAVQTKDRPADAGLAVQTKDRPADAGLAVQTKDRPADAGRSLVCQFGLCDVRLGVHTPSGEHTACLAQRNE